MSKVGFKYLEKRKQSYEDFKFMRQLTESIHKLDGHYEMPLPFSRKDDNSYCERVSNNYEPQSGTRWFIPNYEVYHSKKSKISVVFDCSAQYVPSLNTLLQGPNMINDLIGVICRFRKEPIAISCDNEKMFYQFYRDYLSFVWWDNDD